MMDYYIINEKLIWISVLNFGHQFLLNSWQGIDTVKKILIKYVVFAEILITLWKVAINQPTLLVRKASEFPKVLTLFKLKITNALMNEINDLHNS